MEKLKATKKFVSSLLAIASINRALVKITLLTMIFALTVMTIASTLSVEHVETSTTTKVGNLLGDPGFDESTNPGGFPNSGYWNDDHIGEAGAVLDGLNYRSSPYSLHIYTGVAETDYFSGPYQNGIPSIPDQAYNAEAYLSTPSGFGWADSSKAFIRISFLNSSGYEISYNDSSYYDSVSTDWQIYNLTTDPAPDGTEFVQFRIWLEKPDTTQGQSIVNVDDCFLEELPYPLDIRINPTFLNFGASNEEMVFAIYNIGGGTLNWSIPTNWPDWITEVTPTSESTMTGEPDYVTIQVNRGGLNAGEEYTATLTVTPDVGEPKDIPIYMTVPTNVPSQPSIVSVVGTQLILQKRLPDGSLDLPRPYKIKGFAWSPASVETADNYTSRRQAFFDWNEYDLGMMKGCNTNTVYVFLDFGLDPDNYLTILDNLYEDGIMAIITVDEDGSYNLTNLQNVVNAYKNHPAVLMWAIGNEWNINLYNYAFNTVQEAAIATEDAALLIKSLDLDHPVASIYGEINIPDQIPNTYDILNNICPSVDIWGLNIYRGEEFYSLFDEWASITNKPMFLSEFGIDSYHTTQYYPNPVDGYPDEQEQADWGNSLWIDLYAEISANDLSKVCLGGTYFEWNDEWWKVDPPGQQDKDGFYTEWNPSAFPDAFANEEYFGIVKIDGNVRMPKLSYYIIKQDFQVESAIEGTITLEGGTGNVAEVEVITDGVTSNPNSMGYYIIEIMPGTYDVTASLEGYTHSTIVGVEVFEGQLTTSIDIALETDYLVDDYIFNNPSVFKLSQNYPNPFGKSTTISFYLNHKDVKDAKIRIYNLKGQIVKHFAIRNPQSKANKVVWDGKDENGNELGSGIYFYKLSTPDKTFLKKMVLMR